MRRPPKPERRRRINLLWAALLRGEREKIPPPRVPSGWDFLNPNIKIRNPKQILNLNFQMFKTV